MTQRMITCCPACSTLFRVGLEQLQVAGGWVRCGQCMVAFDARARMLPADPYAPPPDPHWHADAGETDAEPPRGSAQDGAAPAPAPEPAPVPQASAAEIPAFTAPAFELVPPPSPLEPAAVPVFVQRAPERDITGRTPAAPQARAQPSQPSVPAPSLPIPTDDELDRRYARLLETLARLRENAEKHNSQLDAADTNPPSDAPGHTEDSGPAARNSGRSGTHDDPQRRTSRRDAARDPERGTASGRKREHEDRPRESDRRSPLDTQPAEHQQDEEAQHSRPMIDFVLSEINGLLPLPPSVYSQQEPEPWPAKPEVPSFVEQARRRAVWALPAVRAGLWVAAGILTLTLAAQIAVSQRDRLAAKHPDAAPLLQALCRPLHCQIAPWRHLGAVVIDSSTFVRMGSKRFGFAVTLRNSGAAPIATPDLELVLIDAQEQPLARRVLNPTDWGAPAQLTAYGEFNGVALLTVLGAVDAQGISNYRLTAFYP